jgi:tripartite-type tricarboxylate transporter receptor subunit TctC
MRSTVSLLIGLFAVFSTNAVDAQDYPSRPVKIVVPYTPGGIDTVARLVGSRLSDIWKQPVVIENRPGASGVIGVEFVTKSAPDGYTLLMTAGSDLTVTPHVINKATYNPPRDLAAIVMATDSPLIFAAPATAPFNTIREMIAFSKTQPGGLAFSNPGSGTIHHLTVERFALETGAKILHIAYKGGTPAFAAIAAGEVPVGIASAASAIRFIKSGRVKVVATATARRIALGPDWPTIAESGVPGFQASLWTAMAAPVGTPREVVARINADTNRVLKMPEVRERLASAFIEVVGSTPEELGAKIRDESDRYGKLVKQLNLKFE